MGARTASSQIHRQMASNVSFPIAFKNTTEGNIEIALHGVEVSKNPHTFIGLNMEGKLSLIRSSGNPYAHLVLRGGEREPNYDVKHIPGALLAAPYLLVDCSHDNSRKDPFAQMAVFEEVSRQIAGGERRIRGMMIESFLYEGRQSLSPQLTYGVSLTDACLDFESTQHLIRKHAASLLCATV